MTPLDDVRRLLGHHDDGNVDVAARNRRKDRAVDDPESANVPDSEFGVDHSCGVTIQGPHFAGSDRVVVRSGEMDDPTVPVFIRVLEIRKLSGN